MTIKASFPTIRPTLNLDFANSKRLDPRVTFTRNSVGTYFDAAGVLRTAAVNEPRFDHDPATGESLGLLVEESRTNLLLRSEEFDQSPWNNAGGGSVSPNSWVAPNGALTGDVFTVGSSSIEPNQSVTVTASTNYVFSFYYNSALTTAAFIRIRTNNASSSVSTYVNTSTNQFGTAGSGITNLSITQVSGSIYRVAVLIAYGASDGGSRALSIAGVTADNGGTADTGKDLALWGAQLEAGAFPTSYIKTEASAATRAADTCSLSGSNFSSWYRQDEGTVFASYVERAQLQTHQIYYAQGVSSAERIAITVNPANVLDGVITSGGVDSFAGDTPTLTAQNYRVGLAFKTNSAGISANGSTVAKPDDAVVPPTVSGLTIGSRPDSTQVLNSAIKRLTFWPQRLGNEVLQRITQ